MFGEIWQKSKGEKNSGDAPPNVINSPTYMADGIAHNWQLGFQEAASPVMERIDGFHDFLLYVTGGICLFVLALLLFCALRFRARANPIPSKTSHNNILEVVWIVIPIVILAVIALPSLRLHYMEVEIPKADLTIKATGHQWYWEYSYPDHGDFAFDALMLQEDELGPGQPRLLATDAPVVVPVNATVRVLITASDVLHSWALPALGVKMDAVPGRLNETWFRAKREGIFYGQCSELCGVGHAFMPIEVHVVDRPAFDAWIAEQRLQAGIEPEASEQTTSETTTTTGEKAS